MQEQIEAVQRMQEYIEKRLQEDISFADVAKVSLFSPWYARRLWGAMLEVGLPYLSLGQHLSTLSGGECQRVKLAKYLDKKGNIYVLDEPTTGLHASDVQKVMELLDSLVDRGNTVIVIEHNLDVMKQADWIVDVGPVGGEIVFAGTPKDMAEHSHTITEKYLRKSM